MSLSPEQSENLLLWLDQQGVNPVCQSCGNNNWRGGELLLLPIMFGQPNTPPTAVPIGSEAYIAYVTVVCNHCGFVKFYSARNAGLI